MIDRRRELAVADAHRSEAPAHDVESQHSRGELRIAVEGRTSRDTLVREVMTSPVLVVSPETTIEEAMALMTDRRIRHAPVVDGDSLAGMVSIGDLVRQQSLEHSFQVRYLTEYITAR